MFDSFISWLMNGVTGAASLVIRMLLECLDIDLAQFVEYFPVAPTLYVILQSVAVAFVFAFAAWNLGKFLTGRLANLTESPAQILVMSGVAGFLIYFGNYLLQAVVNIFSYPYADILAVDATHNNFSMQAVAGLIETVAIGMSGTVGTAVVLATALVVLVVVVMLAYQIISLLFEMVERWIMLGVLVFTSPLAWATVVSANTRTIFQKWLNMFLSQCLLLLINAWSVKMLFSVMTYEHAGLVSVVLALCFCKVARQLDTYLKQIGLNPAGTGRSLLDDIRSTAVGLMMAARMGARGSSGGSGVLGSQAQYNSASAAAQRISEHNNKSFVGRAWDWVAHPLQTGKDRAAVIRGGLNGTLTEEGVGGKTGLRTAISQIAGIQDAGNQHIVGAGPDGKFGRNAARSKSRIDNMMPRSGVTVSGKGEKAALMGDRMAQAGAIGMFGQDAAIAGRKDVSTAMSKAAAGMNGEELAEAVNSAENMANPEIANAMMHNLADQAGLYDDLMREKYDAIQGTAESMDSEEQRDALLMEQFGSAQAGLSMEEAKESYDRINAKFGADAGEDAEYALLSPDGVETIDTYGYDELSESGQQKVMDTAQAHYSSLMETAAQSDARAETLEQQAAELKSQDPVGNAGEAARMESRAAALRNTASEVRAEASGFAGEYFTESGTIKDDADLTNPAFRETSLSWNDLSDSYKARQLEDIKTEYADLMSSGNYTQAANFSMSRTGTLDPRHLTVSDLDHISRETGYRTIENMAFTKNGTWREVVADDGEIRGTYSYRTIERDPVSGRPFGATASKTVSYATQSAAREYDYSRYTPVRVGNTTFVQYQSPVASGEKRNTLRQSTAYRAAREAVTNRMGTDAHERHTQRRKKAARKRKK